MPALHGSLCACDNSWGNDGTLEKNEKILFRRWKISSFRCLQFSPDGTSLAAGTNDKRVHMLNFQTGEILATMEGHAFADTFFGNNPRQADHTNVPSAVFSQPPVGSVGLSESQARESFANVDTYR